MPAAPSRRPRCRSAASRAEVFADLVQGTPGAAGAALAPTRRHRLHDPRSAPPRRLRRGLERRGGAPGGTIPAYEGHPARVVVYRRPVEIRTKGRDERAALVHEVVVEQVVQLLG